MEYTKFLTDSLTFVRNNAEYKWEKVLNLFNNDERFAVVAGSALVLSSVFWVTNAFFMFLDLTGKPSFLIKYKIDQHKNVPVNKKKFAKCLKVVVRNELITYATPILLYLWMKKFGINVRGPLPSILRVIFDIIIFGVVDEVVFYYSHRLLHHRAIYKHIHKQHHDWIVPISIASSYAHPIEHVISNIMSLFFGPMLAGSHIITAWIWFALTQFITCINHSNYHFPGMNSPQFHNYHHAKFNECFGTTGFLDWLHSTDTNFQKSIEGKRNITFYSLKPITEIVPDAVFK